MAMLTDGQAREIASFYQSPGAHGKSLAAFASTGTMFCDLIDDIERELKAEESEVYQGQLRALHKYVNDWQSTWQHDIVAGMMNVDAEDIAAVNAERDIECQRCGKEWAKGEYDGWLPL